MTERRFFNSPPVVSNKDDRAPVGSGRCCTYIVEARRPRLIVLCRRRSSFYLLKYLYVLIWRESKIQRSKKQYHSCYSVDRCIGFWMAVFFEPSRGQTEIQRFNRYSDPRTLGRGVSQISQLRSVSQIRSVSVHVLIQSLRDVFRLTPM
jgi:hypothetical protein